MQRGTRVFVGTKFVGTKFRKQITIKHVMTQKITEVMRSELPHKDKDRRTNSLHANRKINQKFPNFV